MGVCVLAFLTLQGLYLQEMLRYEDPLPLMGPKSWALQEELLFVCVKFMFRLMDVLVLGRFTVKVSVWL